MYVYKVGNLEKKKTDEYVKKPERLNPRMIALYEVSFSSFVSNVMREYETDEQEV